MKSARGVVRAEVPRTYWNGAPAPACRVRVVVGDTGRFPHYWARELVGTEVEAVRVMYAGEIFYLDDRDGSGWGKVTTGRGGPAWRSRSLDVEREVLRL